MRLLSRGEEVILLAVSYAYQRYKELIFGTSSTTRTVLPL